MNTSTINFTSLSLESNTWEAIDKFKKKLTRINTVHNLVNTITQTIREGVNGNYCTWVRIQRFDEQGEYLSEELKELGTDFKSLHQKTIINQSEIIDLITHRETIHKEKFDRIHLELTYNKNGHNLMLRLGEPGYKTDNWIVVDGIESHNTEAACFFIHSISTCIAKAYITMNHHFDINSTVLNYFDRMFTSSHFHIELDDQFNPINISSIAYSYLIELFPDYVHEYQFPEKIVEKLKHWNEKETRNANMNSQISLLTLRVFHRNIVLCVKYSTKRKIWTIVLCNDLFQENRMEQAKNILTSRQFEAFVHYENGAKSSEALSHALEISPRTAERYHANILYMIKNGMIAS